MDFSKLLLVFSVLLGVLSAAPAPDGHHHKKYIIHVPYKVHTIHHHHVKKIPVYHHYEHFNHHHHHHHEEQIHHDYHEDYHDEHY